MNGPLSAVSPLTAAQIRDCTAELSPVDAVGRREACTADQKPHVRSTVNDAIRLILADRNGQTMAGGRR